MSEVDMRACVVCGRRRELEYHHRNGNAQDNRAENGVCLCRRCHVAIHAEKNRQRNRARRSRNLQALRARVDAAERGVDVGKVVDHLAHAWYVTQRNWHGRQEDRQFELARHVSYALDHLVGRPCAWCSYGEAVASLTFASKGLEVLRQEVGSE